MPWQYLTPAKLLTMPNVLAGPILRDVTADSVTVWFALQKKATVKLTVMTKTGTRLFDGSRDTIAVGARLHIVAVTARRLASEPKLVDDTIYTYDASFVYGVPLPGDPVTPPDLNIASATQGVRLTYAGFNFPSFCMPASNIKHLRILHGSCRKAAGDGMDTFAIADSLIDEKKDVPLERPQQLLLTGDQIYADDVAPHLLMMLTDASTVLMGWDEGLPIETGVRTPASQLPPFSRRAILEKCKFTSEDLDHHLMSLGEYLCMYLFMWSDVLWPPLAESPSTPLVKEVGQPFYDARTNPKVRPRKIDTPPSVLAKRKADAMQTIEDTIHDNILRVNKLRLTLSNVRRAMANITTYMGFDDHEVADDWNMTEYTAFHLYNTFMGQRVVQNALAAYALCQHWGNVPDQFLSSNPNLPGTKLLGLLNATTHSAPQYETNSFAIGTLLSVHNGEFVEQNLRVEHAPGTLTWNYTIEGLAHQILVLDTRTWRTYPGIGGEPPDLLPPSQMMAQIVNTPPLNNRQLIVVTSTNMPPVNSIRTATDLHFVSNRFRHFPDVNEAWELPSVAFDRLVKALSDKVGFSAAQNGRVVMLSGDVHTGFASRLHYKAIKRFEDAGNQHANVVIAQLVASSFKKQDADTIGMQRQGYTYAPKVVVSPLIPPHITEYYVGWNMQASGQLMGTWGGLQLRLGRASTVRLFQPLPHPFIQKLEKAPDYSYQLDYLEMTAGGTPLNLLPLPKPPARNTPSGPSADELTAEASIAALTSTNYRTFNRDSDVVHHIIGVNNIGDLTFPVVPLPGAGPPIANHKLRFFDSKGNQRFVEYQVVLNDFDPIHPNDPKNQFKQVTP